MCLVVLQVLNGDESKQVSVEKERQSEAVPDVIVEAQYGEDENEELRKKMDAAALQDKGVCVCVYGRCVSVQVMIMLM